MLNTVFWQHFSFYLCFFFSFFSPGVLQESGLHTVHQHINCLLTCTILITDCSWIIPLTWSQQNTVAKELEVIAISHIPTRAKDAFVWNHYYFFFLQGKQTPKHKLQQNSLHMGGSWLSLWRHWIEYSQHTFGKKLRVGDKKRSRRISVADWGMDLQMTFTTSPPQLDNALWNKKLWFRLHPDYSEYSIYREVSLNKCMCLIDHLGL